MSGSWPAWQDGWVPGAVADDLWRRLQLLADQLVLPRGVRVDRAIALVCDLLIAGADTPSTVQAAATTSQLSTSPRRLSSSA
jgi:hypothetical protein